MAQPTKKRKVDNTLPFGKKNLQILSLGLIVIVIGYIAMAQPPVNSFWSLTLAPVLLLAAYFLIVPYAIMFGHKLFARADSGQQEGTKTQEIEKGKKQSTN